MRRGFTSLLMGISLLLGSLGWAGLTLSSTLLDEDASQTLAQTAMDHPSVRAVLTGRLADGMTRIVPEDVPMSRQELAAAAGNALDDPAGRSSITKAVATAHSLGVAGGETDEFFTHIDSNEAARMALFQERPELKGRILANPLVRVSLPIAGLTWLAGLNGIIESFAIFGVAAGLIGFAAAFVIARDAAGSMRRAAWWVLGAAAFWVGGSMLFGALLQALVPSSYIVLAVSAEGFFAAMQGPSVLMTIFGLGMLATSALVPAMKRRRGAFIMLRNERRTMRAAGQPAH